MELPQITHSTRAGQLNQVPRCIWFTGLSGSGKSTIANLLERHLVSIGRHTYVLDGDIVRRGLNCDLGYTDEDRKENTRRVAEVAKLMVDAGLIVLVSLISPFVAEREMARNLFSDNEFIEVFVDTPFDECARRDTKGLYVKALRGELKNFSGLDSAYERPPHPDVHLLAAKYSPDQCVLQLLQILSQK